MILIISPDNDTMTDAVCVWLSRLEKQFVRLNENQMPYSITKCRNSSRILLGRNIFYCRFTVSKIPARYY